MKRRSRTPRRNWIGAAICFALSLIGAAIAAFIVANFPNGILQHDLRLALELGLVGSGGAALLFVCVAMAALQPRRRR